MLECNVSCLWEFSHRTQSVASLLVPFSKSAFTSGIRHIVVQKKLPGRSLSHMCLAGVITADILKSVLRSFDKKAKATCVFHCCHSGSVSGLTLFYFTLFYFGLFYFVLFYFI